MVAALPVYLGGSARPDIHAELDENGVPDATVVVFIAKVPSELCSRIKSGIVELRTSSKTEYYKSSNCHNFTIHALN